MTGVSSAGYLGVTLEVEGIDRMYLNVYIPGLQREEGVACFFRFHRGMSPPAERAIRF